MTEWGHLIPRSYASSLKTAVRGEGIYIWDEDGKQYIDGCSGALLSSIGHGVREIREAMIAQLESIEFAHPSRWVSKASVEAADAVASIAPAGLSQVWLVSGGSEAIESALKISRQYFVERDGAGSAKSVYIARWNSYHGSTIGTMALAGSMARRQLYAPIFKEGPKIETHYCYRCPYGKTYPECDVVCARRLESEIRRIGPQYVAAFVAEPVVGSTVGGLHPPAEYWPIIREICGKYDVLLIADEIMTGFGRTGKPFCVNHWNVTPDIICTAKAITGGYAPAGGIIVRDEIVETLRKGSGAFVHGHTYNANPVTAAAVVATVKYMKDHDVFGNAVVQGERLGKALASVADNPIVGEVRGMGMMRGVELVMDKTTKEPFPASFKAAGAATAECFKRGLVIYPGTGQIDGCAGDQFLLAPPLVATAEQIDEIVRRLGEGLAAAAEILLAKARG